MIVIIAKEDDNHAVAVKKVLESVYNENVFVFDTSKFPTIYRLNGNFSNGAISFSLEDGKLIKIDLHDVKSFWWRRPQGIMIDPAIHDDKVRNFTHSECLSAIYGILKSCDALWVNDMEKDDRADYKPFQLKTAIKVGFHVPDTLITNDPQKAMDFWHRHNQKIVYKAFNQRGIIWCPTRLLRAEDLALISQLQYAPAIFQPLLPGNRDIRVTVIGENIFATEFINQDANNIDYRLNIRAETSRAHQLPRKMIDQLKLFMHTLGLEYGGIDFRLTPNGDYVFFEINTGGEFMYVQELTGQPIAEAMAYHLAKGKRVNG